MPYLTFTATDSIGRAGSVFLDPTAPVNGAYGHFSLDHDPGFGSMHSMQALTMLTITAGPADGLRALAAWGRSRSRWTPAGWSERLDALAGTLS